MLKVIGHHTEDFEHENLSLLCYTSRALTLNKLNCGNNDGFGREPMVLAIFKPEDIASQVKRAELTAAVLQQFVRRRGSDLQLILPEGRCCMWIPTYVASSCGNMGPIGSRHCSTFRDHEPSKGVFGERFEDFNISKLCSRKIPSLEFMRGLPRHFAQ